MTWHLGILRKLHLKTLTQDLDKRDFEDLSRYYSSLVTRKTKKKTTEGKNDRPHSERRNDRKYRLPAKPSDVVGRSGVLPGHLLAPCPVSRLNLRFLSAGRLEEAA